MKELKFTCDNRIRIRIDSDDSRGVTFNFIRGTKLQLNYKDIEKLEDWLDDWKYE